MKAMIEQNVLQTISLLLNGNDSALLTQLAESIEQMTKALKESGMDVKEIIKLYNDNQSNILLC
jgi:hypothetical protein